jgi:hypothetical protein
METHKAFVDLLSRLRLHTCVAYIRKYCQKEAIRRVTLVCRVSKSWIIFVLNSHSWVPRYILHVETAVNPCWYRLVPPTLVYLIEGDFRIACLARDLVSCALFGMSFSSTHVPF